MSGAPAEATARQLREVHVKVEGLPGA
jgi:hypothetical protein